MNKYKKIAIIAPTVIREMPYLNIYYNYLNEKGYDIDIINWNRFDEEEKYIKDKITYVSCIRDNNVKIKKAFYFFKYQKFIKKILIKNNYEKLIILCPQTVLFIYKFIVKNYNKRYILDIRDYSVVFKFKKIINILLKNSFFISVSSKGYLTWLPKNYKYIISNNIDDCSIKKHSENIKNKESIIIATIGSIRDFDGNRMIIESLKNLEFKKLEFYGKGIDEDKLKRYCVDNFIENIKFYGKYDSKDEDDIYKKIDFVNAYTNEMDNIGNITALPNRLYKAARFVKPIIVRKNTYLGDIVEEFNLGISIDLSKENLQSAIDKYIENYNYNNLEKNTCIFLEKIKKEVENFKNELDLFL